jgi:hypothetical protein
MTLMLGAEFLALRPAPVRSLAVSTTATKTA